MANTTNYNWETPDDTDLVKDGAAAIRTLGSSVDTTTKALNPSTTLGDIEYRSATANTNTRLGIGSTGQVLTVAGGVPTWATSDDANAIQNAIVDAKGDLIAASAADTPARLAVGTNGQVLTADSAEATGLKWATPAGGGGKVLQVVSTTYSTEVTVASSTFSDTGLTLNITPTSATSTILVLANVGSYATRNNDGQDVKLRLVRNSTAINTQDGASNIYAAGDTAVAIGFFGTLIYQDSPATTSATTYKMQGAVSSTSNSGQVVFQQNNRTSTITLLEIGA
jgi:hypothetical protein